MCRAMSEALVKNTCKSETIPKGNLASVQVGLDMDTCISVGLSVSGSRLEVPEVWGRQTSHEHLRYRIRSKP
jgi:hypothetical protein